MCFGCQQTFDESQRFQKCHEQAKFGGKADGMLACRAVNVADTEE